MIRNFVLSAVAAGASLALYGAADAPPQFNFQTRVVADAQYPFALRLQGAIGRMDVLQRTAPEYPSEAKNSGIEGDVTMAVVVGVDGRVLGAQPVSGNPILAVAAVNAVKQWTYEPIMRSGEAAEVEGLITIPFRLPDGASTIASASGAVKRISLVRASAAPIDAPHQPIRLTAPVLLSKTEPEYPFAERAAGVNGSVALSLTIGANGMPKNVQVLQSIDPVLDRNAMAAVSQWKFAPAKQDGAAVETTVNAEVQFRQEGPGPSLNALAAQSVGRSAGIVTLQGQVAPDGRVSSLRVQRSLGFGFDERAIEAAGQWLEQGNAAGVGSDVVIQVEFD